MFRNSAVTTGLTVSFCLLAGTFAAYSISRYRFRGRGGMLTFYLLVRMFPVVLMLLPLYIMLRTIGLIDSLFGLALTYTTFLLPTSLLMLKGFFDAVPPDLEDAARIDGSTRIGALFRVVLPLARSGIAASAFMYMLTGSPLMVGLLNFAGFLPILLFSLFGGVVGDRFDRRRVIVTTHLASMSVALLVAAVTFAGVAAPWVLIVAALSLATGSLWGRPMWGTWWIWDARLTSELILFFLYIGFIALQAAIDDPRRADKAGAVLALVGVVNVPIIYFSVIWWNSLHQGSSVSLTKSPSIAQTMFAGMILMALCFWMYSIAVALMRVRAIIIERERNAEWVRTEISMEKTNAVE